MILISLLYHAFFGNATGAEVFKQILTTVLESIQNNLYKIERSLKIKTAGAGDLNRQPHLPKSG